MSTKDAIKETLDTALDEIGVDLKQETAAIAAYAAERATFLASIVGQPGYAEAVRAERDNVALRAGIATVAQATSAEQRLLGVLQAALQMGAAALVA